MRRQKLVVVLAALAAAIAVGAAMLWPQEDRITVEFFNRLHKGMTRAEVEATLGPAGDYSTGPTLSNSMPFDDTFVKRTRPVCDDDQTVPISRPEYRPLELTEWRSDRLFVGVSFNSSGRVDWMCRRDVFRVRQNAFENVRWRAERQWHRWFPE